MKFLIGSIVVSIDHLPTHPLTTHLFRDQLDDEAIADCVLTFSEVEKRNWDMALPYHKGNCWYAGAETVNMDYDFDQKALNLTLVSDGGFGTEYWLRRFFFAALGGISGQQLIHSSAMIKNGEGYVFTAASGVGKSTLYNNLSDYVEQVNDETNWVFKADGQYVLVNQNYYFNRSELATVPLKKMCMLERGVPRLEPSKDPVMDFTILISVHPPFDNFDPFMEQRSKAIRALQTEFPIEIFYANLVPKELAEALFGSDVKKIR